MQRRQGRSFRGSCVGQGCLGCRSPLPAAWAPGRAGLTRRAAVAGSQATPHPEGGAPSPWQLSKTALAGVLAAALLAAPAGATAFPAGAQQRPEASVFSAGAHQLFDPESYAGRWYEVASLKLGFAGEGQADCHCTQGIYVPRSAPGSPIRLEVNTFCVHGGRDGRLSGIQGVVTCADPALLALLPEFETDLEREQGILEKCVLRFPSIPFIPAEPYDILRTDYTSYALVAGAQDRSFVQVYSRVPRPGPAFLAARRAELAALGYPQVVDTPQDCQDEVPVAALMAAMDAGMARGGPGATPEAGMAAAMRGMDLGPVKGVAFGAGFDPLRTLRDLGKLLQPRGP